MKNRHTYTLTAAAVVVSTSLAALTLYLGTDGLLVTLVALILPPLAWASLELKYRGKSLDEGRADELATVRWSIGMAGLIVATSLLSNLAQSTGVLGFVESDLERRISGVVFGIVFFLYSNAIPKRPIARSKLSSAAAVQGRSRFAGRVFAIAALLYALIWAFGPLAIAIPTSASVLVVSMIVVAGRGSVR